MDELIDGQSLAEWIQMYQGNMKQHILRKQINQITHQKRKIKITVEANSNVVANNNE